MNALAKLAPRSQAERRARTRTDLMDAARALFVEKGFAETGTPEIVARAGVTRGALYHQFTDKADLFRAVAEREAGEVGRLIDEGTRTLRGSRNALDVGTRVYFQAMAVPGRATLLLVQAPAVLGPEVAGTLAGGHGVVQLRAGLTGILPDIDAAELDALTDVLSAAFDRAALAIARGACTEAYVRAVLRAIRTVAQARATRS